jgi:hypothetical protein
MFNHTIVAILLLSATVTSFAAYKCKKPDGTTAFQDTPCPVSSSSEKFRIQSYNSLGDASDRPDHIRAGIAQSRPVVGMTYAELEREIGRPSKVNAAQYGKDFKDQLIYYTETRTIYVYTHNGIVTSIQNTDGGQRTQPTISTTAPSPSRPIKTCPSPSQIRDIEFELSKIEYRDKPQVLAELQRQLGAARSCTPY